MSTTTDKLGLIKPELTDPADITAFNQNWDTLDEKIDSLEQKTENLSGTSTDVTYDNSNSSLESDNVQDALDELSERKGAQIYTATISTTWIENDETGVSSQTVAIDGITAENTAQVDALYNGDGTSDGYAAYVEQQNQFLDYITNGYAETVNGGITFYIFGDANTVEIPIVVEVV